MQTDKIHHTHAQAAAALISLAAGLGESAVWQGFPPPPDDAVIYQPVGTGRNRLQAVFATAAAEQAHLRALILLPRRARDAAEEIFAHVAELAPHLLAADLGARPAADSFTLPNVILAAPRDLERALDEGLFTGRDLDLVVVHDALDADAAVRSSLARLRRGRTLVAYWTGAPPERALFGPAFEAPPVTIYTRRRLNHATPRALVVIAGGHALMSADAGVDLAVVDRDASPAEAVPDTHRDLEQTLRPAPVTFDACLSVSDGLYGDVAAALRRLDVMLAAQHILNGAEAPRVSTLLPATGLRAHWHNERGTWSGEIFPLRDDTPTGGRLETTVSADETDPVVIAEAVYAAVTEFRRARADAA